MTDREPLSAEVLVGGGVEPTPWTWVQRHLQKAPATYWLATARSDGRPHVRPVLAVWTGGAVYFCTGPRTRKARNLERDSHCVLTVAEEPLHLVIEGRAARVEDEVILRRVADAYASNYDWHVIVRDGAFDGVEGAPTAGPPPYDVYGLTPSMAFGFGTDDTVVSTRWRVTQGG